MKKLALKRPALLISGIVSIIFYITVSISLLPCGWLDISLGRSGCLLKLSTGIPASRVFFTSNHTFKSLDSVGSDLRTWQITDGKLLGKIQIIGDSNDITFSPNRHTLAVSGVHTIYIQDDMGQLIQSLRNDTGDVMDIVFTPDGNILAGAINDYPRPDRIRLWRIDDGKLLQELEGHTHYINSLAMAPNGMILASGSSDSTVRLWRIDDGQPLNILTGHKDQVMSVAFNPEGTLLASGSTDKTIRLWQVSNGVLLQVLREHKGAVISLAFSPDGRILASGGRDGTLRLWRVTDGVLLKTIKHGSFWGWLWDVTFSPDGTLLATTQDRGPVRIFDVQHWGLE